MASHFPAKVSIYPTKPNLTSQVYYTVATLSMEKLAIEFAKEK